MKRMPVKTMFLLVEAGAALSMLALSLFLAHLTGQGWVLAAGVLLTACALVWLFLLTLFFARRLSQFTSDLCQTMDTMISGGEEPAEDRETIFARISYRLSRLYGILKENRRKVDDERRELQTLVSDISHLVKTPVANLKMVTDILFNLLDNAVKYTPAGGRISVSAEQWEMYVKLDVADTGKGIPESRQAAIFRRFYREEEVHDQPGGHRPVSGPGDRHPAGRRGSQHLPRRPFNGSFICR